MLKAILKRSWRDAISGTQGVQYITVDFEAPDVEAYLRRGGFGESGFEAVELVGLEVLNPLPKDEAANA